MDHPIVFLSLGPGDPDLLTLKAVKALTAADVVLVPATRSADGRLKSRATEIIREYCDAAKLKVYELPMQKDRQAVLHVYDDICRHLQFLHSQRQRVAVAVEGDISIYASIHYVMDRLKSDGIPVSQLPGIPSFIAAAAVAGLSLASQRQRLTVLPGDADESTLHRLLADGYVVVVMKLTGCQQAVKDFLRSEPTVQCHYFENVGTEAEFHTADRQEILCRAMPYFSLCVMAACDKNVR